MEAMEQLKQLRIQAGMTQNGLAQEIGKSHTYIWSVEAGRVKLTARETIEAWAKALGVDPYEVYHAIGQVPHDIIDEMMKADTDTWLKIRKLVQQFNEADGR